MKIAILTKNMKKSYAQISTKFHHFVSLRHFWSWQNTKT